MNPSLETVLKSPLTSATCVDLSFDDQLFAPAICNNGASCGFRLFSCSGYLPIRTGNAVFFEQLLRLIFVDIHDIMRSISADVGKLGGCMQGVKVLMSKYRRRRQINQTIRLAMSAY